MAWEESATDKFMGQPYAPVGAFLDAFKEELKGHPEPDAMVVKLDKLKATLAGKGINRLNVLFKMPKTAFKYLLKDDGPDGGLLESPDESWADTLEFITNMHFSVPECAEDHPSSQFSNLSSPP